MILSKDLIDLIFEQAEHQSDIVISLYKSVIPDFDKRDSIPPPRAGKTVSEYVMKRFIQFDRKNHPGVLSGGAWLNYGFSFDENLKDWEVRE
jgi:hypothetical protein